MQLYITHTTTYHYVPQVNTAQHMVHLLPRSNASQSVQRTELHVTPTPSAISTHIDVFGNNRTFFSLPVLHNSLIITAKSLVDTHFIPYPPELALSTSTWENVREHFLYHSGAAWDAATEYVFSSPYVQTHPDFAEYAQDSFKPSRPILLAACDLMTRIHEEFTYETASTNLNTPALEALKNRKGVCQDFAHILIGCLRSQGLAARYVSGYLVTDVPQGQSRLIGSDASHAWVSVYVPNELENTAKTLKCGQLANHGKWFDLDPTNNRWGLTSPGIDYVTLAIGRDYSDVSPVRGVIHGGASHSLEVGVTVQPAAELVGTPETTQIQDKAI